MPIPMPADAFRAFLTDEITVRAGTRATGELATEAVRIPVASVSAPGTDPAAVVAGVDAVRWTVEFPAASWTASQPPAPGSIVEAGARWPELYVQSAFPLAELWHLVCSSKEGAKQ